MKLTEKQRRFVDYYIETGNATDSYKRAYNSTNDNTAAKEGHKLLNNPKITQELKTKLTEKDTKRIADQNEVLEYLTHIMRGQMTEKTLVGVGKGYQQIEDIEVSAKDRIKAAELLGKRYAMWTDRQEMQANIGVTIVDDIDED